MSRLPPSPASSAEARSHIEAIRCDNGVAEDSAKGLKSQFQKLLQLVGEQLYQESTHFLFELIQNADDNSYSPGVAPTLTFTLDGRFLRVDCNETGFQPNHVQALCSVAMSTKTVPGKGSQYVGEKGLGFKSVFKVADVVWISSGFYTFKLDKHTELGMIGPVWDEFPSETKPGYTSFYLQLSSNCNMQELRNDLLNLDSSSLLFLRKLATVKILIRQGKAATETVLRKETKETGKPGMVVTTLHRNKESQTFVVCKKTIGELPRETRRSGSLQSEVCLAFPLDAKLKPQIGPQSVYAFLPVRSYGFSVLLHGDFILTASRQDIEIGNAWNDNIVLEQSRFIPEVFMHFASSNSGLRRTWPRFIPFGDGGRSVFETEMAAVRERLRDLPLFESQAFGSGQERELSSLKSLRYVPRLYRDTQGVPITNCKETAKSYLALGYADGDVDVLKRLKLSTMNSDSFLRDLETLITQCSADFQGRPTAYHASLAKALLAHVPETRYRERIRALPIIRTRSRGAKGANWIAAANRKVFFPEDSRSKAVPEGVKADIVVPEFAQDAQIRLLYVALGVGQLSSQDICELIIDTHNDPSFKPQSLQRGQLVSHAMCLFDSNYREKKKASGLWICTKVDRAVRARDAYIDLDVEHPVKVYLGEGSSVPFPHSAYLSAAADRAEDFCQWAQASMGLSSIPRLASYTTTDGRFEMTPEFKWILEKKSSLETLYLLRDNWDDEYSLWFHSDMKKRPASKQSMGELIKAISHTHVDCMRNTRVPLYQSFVPLREWLSYASQVPLLNIPDDDLAAWEFLKLFGVGVKRNVRVFLDILRRFRAHPVTDATLPQVRELYYHIQQRTQEDAKLVCDLFADHDLVFLPGAENTAPTWVPLKSCTWDGPDLRHFKSIRSVYPQNETLFCTILRLKNLEIGHLLHEMKHFRDDEGLDYVEYIFNWLNEYRNRVDGSTHHQNAPQIREIARQRIFPVAQNGKGPKGYDSLEDGKAASPWFISDRKDFEDSFMGKVPLLAFGWETNQKFKGLFATMGLGSRVLSASAKDSPVVGGFRTHHRAYTKLLRRKVDFMVRLIPEKLEQRGQIATSLRNLQVFGVDSLQRRWCVTSGGTDIYGDAVDTKCLLETQGDSLHILLLETQLRFRHSAFHHTLAKLLADYCHAEEHLKYLMNPVITEPKHDVVDSLFVDEGVRNLTADEERDKKASYFQDIDNHPNGGGQASSRQSNTPAPRARKSIAEGLKLPQKIRVYDARGRKRGDEANKAEGKRRVGKGPNAFDADGSDDATLEVNLVSSDDESSDSGHDDSDDGDSGESGGFVAFLERGSKLLRKRKKKTEAAPSKFDQDLAADGEFFISRLLTNALPGFYEPVQHWTSTFREIAGVPPVEPSEADRCNSSFIIPDQFGSFTKFLVSTGLSECSAWLEQPPIYHLEAITTRRGLNSSFFMRKTWWRTARRHSAGGTLEQREKRGNVCLLVRVYNWSSEPEVAFYLDPWNHFIIGKLKLEPESMYKGRIRRTDDDWDE